MRITIIEDSRESQIKFLESLSTSIEVQIQAVTVAPFFDRRIERAIEQFNPELIILDLLLTENVDSGFHVLRHIKKSELLKHVPIVVCSKFIGPDPNNKYRMRALELGAANALPKIPFPDVTAFLVARIDKHTTDEEAGY